VKLVVAWVKYVIDILFEIDARELQAYSAAKLFVNEKKAAAARGCKRKLGKGHCAVSRYRREIERLSSTSHRLQLVPSWPD
jgi:hypothetical protein